MRRRFWSRVYWLYAWWLGLKNVRRTALGSRVRYKGEVWSISNWADSAHSNLSGPGDKYEKHVSRDEFTPVLSLGELWHRITMLRWWWMTCWHGIAVRRRSGHAR